MLSKIKICNSTYNVYDSIQSKLNQRFFENGEITYQDEIEVFREVDSELEDFNKQRNLALLSLIFAIVMFYIGLFIIIGF